MTDQPTPAVIECGPRKIARRITVNASAAEIFAPLADPHRHHEVDGSESVRAAVSGPTRLALGDTFTMSMKLGVPYQTTSTVTALTPDELIEWEPKGGHRWRWELRALDATTTEVTETFDYSRSRAAKVLEIVGLPRRNARGIEASLRKLRAQYS